MVFQISEVGRRLGLRREGRPGRLLLRRLGGRWLGRALRGRVQGKGLGWGLAWVPRVAPLGSVSITALGVIRQMGGLRWGWGGLGCRRGGVVGFDGGRVGGTSGVVEASVGGGGKLPSSIAVASVTNGGRGLSGTCCGKLFRTRGIFVEGRNECPGCMALGSGSGGPLIVSCRSASAAYNPADLDVTVRVLCSGADRDSYIGIYGANSDNADPRGLVTNTGDLNCGLAEVMHVSSTMGGGLELKGPMVTRVRANNGAGPSYLNCIGGCNRCVLVCNMSNSSCLITSPAGKLGEYGFSRVSGTAGNESVGCCDMAPVWFSFLQ